jgi:succinate dehydrogenase/fumarate reductase flavoprotein subunit
MKNKTRWILQATSGLILTGSGLSMAIDAGITKLQEGDWFFYGTGALIFFQAGLCLVIDAAKFK